MSAPSRQQSQHRQEQGQQEEQPRRTMETLTPSTMMPVGVPVLDPSTILYTTADTWAIPPPVASSNVMVTSANLSQYMDAGSFKPPIGVTYPESSSTDDNTYPGTPEEWSQSMSPESSSSGGPMLYSTQPSPHFGRMMPPGTLLGPTHSQNFAADANYKQERYLVIESRRSMSSADQKEEHRIELRKSLLSFASVKLFVTRILRLSCGEVRFVIVQSCLQAGSSCPTCQPWTLQWWPDTRAPALLEPV